jgi:AraC-like DNA-binding protein
MSYQAHKVAELAFELVRQEPRLTATEVAKLLGVHRHTLQRALQANCRTFELVKQAVVLERLACHLSDEKTAPLKQLWTELGLTSASTFARYIRRLTGKSPSEHRANGTLGPSARKMSIVSLDVQKGAANNRI